MSLEEICANCQRLIGAREDAFVWKDTIVCQECYNILSAPVEQLDSSPIKPMAPSDEGTFPQGKKDSETREPAPRFYSGWEITDSAGKVILRTLSVAKIIEYLLSGAMSLDDQCFDVSGFRKWKWKPANKKSFKEKRMTEDSFRGTVRQTVGRKELDIQVLFEPAKIYRKLGFKIGFSIVSIGVAGGILVVVLMALALPTVVGPFIAELVAGLIADRSHIPWPVMFMCGAFLGSMTLGWVIGGVPGWLIGHIVGLTKPKQLT